MVLSTMPIGEYDRRVVILTKEQGKISAFARGARRPNSPLVGAVNPLAFGEFTMYEGRTSYTIQSASITNYFAELREDVVGAYYGFYFLEVADYYAKEYTDEREMLKLLYQSMRALINPHIPNRLVRRIFELKALTVNGQAPQVFQCVICGDQERPAVFSPAKGGLVCSECSGDVIDGMILDNSIHAGRETVYIYCGGKCARRTGKSDGPAHGSIRGPAVQIAGDPGDADMTDEGSHRDACTAGETLRSFP